MPRKFTSRLAVRGPNAFVLATAAALVVLVASGCATTKRPHIVWVVVDSWRADHADSAAQGMNLVPHLANKAGNACVFRRAYATSSWTLPSVASLFTGTYPSQHGLVRPGAVLPADLPTAAELLKAAGYDTAAFSANLFVGRGTGLHRGFLAFFDISAFKAGEAKIPGDAVLSAVEEWLHEHTRSQRNPLFLYLHLMDTHWPYGPSREALDAVLPRFGEADKLRTRIAELYFGDTARWQSNDEETRAAIRALYAAQVLDSDRVLDRLFDILDRHGILDEALLVLTSDHGEELLDHGEVGHGRTLYEEVIRVPLWIWFPYQTRPCEVDAVVSLVDVLPTSLEVANVVFAPRTGIPRSRSLTRWRPRRWWEEPVWLWWAGASADLFPNVVFSELLVPSPPQEKGQEVHRGAVVTLREKLLIEPAGAMYAVNLLRDPAEASLSPVSDAAHSPLVAVWQRFSARQPPAAHTTSPVTPDAATQEQLRALGYGD